MMTWRVDARDALENCYRAVDIQAGRCFVDHGVLVFHDGGLNTVAVFGAGSWSACVLVKTPNSETKS